MSRTNKINLTLVIVSLIITILAISLIIARENYLNDIEVINDIMSQGSVEKYFSGQEIESTYLVVGRDEPVLMQQICIDCDDSIANMHNQTSLLITKAPDELCDNDVEQCIIYEYDPFGLGIFKQRELIRSVK